MKVKMKELLWEAAIVILLAVFLANCWINYFLDMISPVPLNIVVPVLAASFCGAFIYFSMVRVRKSAYASMVMCVITCVFITLFMLNPVRLGILESWAGFYLSLRYSVLAVLFSIPFSIGGSFVAAYLYPE